MVTNSIGALNNLPFKGKGSEAARVAQMMGGELAQLEQRMDTLCQEFKERFRAPRFAHLVVRAERTGERRVMWRAKGAKGVGQSYFSLLKSDQGATVLAQLPDEVRKVVLQFEERRAQLNLEYGVRFVVLARLKNYTELRQMLVEARRTAGAAGAGAA